MTIIKPDVKQSETGIMQARDNLAALVDESDMSELLNMIHRPGWITPAEPALVAGLVDSLRLEGQDSDHGEQPEWDDGFRR